MFTPMHRPQAHGNVLDESPLAALQFGVTRIPAFLFLAASACLAAELKPEAVKAYDRYIHDTETRLAAAKPFLWVDSSPDRLKLVKQGQVAVDPWKGDGDTFVPGAS